VFTLQRTAFDPERRIVRLNKTKNGDGRVIGLAGEALDAANAALAHASALHSHYLFCETNGGTISRSTYSNWFRTVSAPGRIFHDLRRTAVRNAISAGVDKHRAMAMTGHRSDKVFDRYDIILESEVVNVAELVEQAARLRKINAELAEKKSQTQPECDSVTPPTPTIGNESRALRGIFDKFRARLSQGMD
jgi:hypothetical protein